MGSVDRRARPSKVSKTPSARVAPGEFEPLGWSPGVLTARFYFLLTVERLVPRVLADLADQPLAQYRALHARADHIQEELLMMGGDINAWQTRWGLSTPWIFAVAAATLNDWCMPPSDSRAVSGQWHNILLRPEMFDDAEAIAAVRPDLAGGVVNAGSVFASAAYAGPDISVVLPGWPLIRLTRSTQRERMLAVATATIDAYLDTCEADAVGLGMTRPPVLNFDHLEWLVRYQVLRHPKGQIARESCRDRTAVGEALEKLARLVGIALRSGTPGRPRK